MSSRHRLGWVIVGACVLFSAGRVSAQCEVIATAVPVAPEARTAPPPLPTALPSAPLARPTAPPTAPNNPGAIRPVNYVPDQPQTGESAAPLVSPTELFSGMTKRPPENTPKRPPENAPPMPTASKPQETPAAPPAQPAEAGGESLSVEVVGAARLTLGQPLAYEMVVRNTGRRALADVRIEQPLPEGARLVRSDPAATSEDKRLRWDLKALEVGAERRIKVELQPGTAGTMDVRPLVTFQPGGMHVSIIRPPFSVEVSADRVKVSRGERVTFTIRLVNSSDAPIRHVKLYDTLPVGLHHPKGPTIVADQFGDLAPGETRTITLETSAVQVGTFANKVVAQADHAIEASGTVDVSIAEPSLVLRLDGPKSGVTKTDLEYRVEVSNPGSMTAKNVRLTQTLPANFEVVSATTGANVDTKRHALLWSLPDLTAGQRQTLTFRVQGGSGGDWPLDTIVLTDNLPEACLANVVHLEGAAHLKLEVRGAESSLAVGAETTYVLHVFNHGDVPCAGVQLIATLPETTTPLDAQGPSAGKIEQQKIVFAKIDPLPARANVVYRVRVRGRQPGAGHVQIELTSAKESPVRKEVSLQVQAPATATVAGANVR